MVLLLLIISLVYDIDSDVNQFSKFYAVRYVPMIISVVYGKDSDMNQILIFDNVAQLLLTISVFVYDRDSGVNQISIFDTKFTSDSGLKSSLSTFLKDFRALTILI